MKPPSLPSTEHFQNMPCGSRAKYIGARCRCMLCRAANSRYQSERAAAIKEGNGNPLVSAAAARAHMAALSRAGVGRRSVQAACDVGDTTLQKIRNGTKTQIRKQTEARILGVDAAAVAGGALISAGRTNRRIALLLEEGFTKKELARRLGSKAKTPALQLRPRRVTVASAAKVERLYRIVMTE